LIVLSLLSGVLLIISELMKGQGMYILSQIFNGGLNNILFLILIVVFIPNKEETDLEDIIYFYALAYMCVIVGGSIYLRIKYKVSKSKGLIDDVITYSIILPIFISTVIVYMFSQIDLWFVSRLFDNDVVAQYGLAIRLTAVLSFSTLSVRAIAAARIPKLMNDIQALQKDVSLSCLFSFLVSLVILS
ncbi:TPA: O163 family O-antigen flippase, partial [Escherichia coli]|nr:O163 family O-antigen flippase [Escherichia coli]